MKVTRRLLTSELRLLLREPLVLAFVFAFPVITVLVLGGVFDEDDTGFEGVLPSDFYIAAYFGVVIAAVGLIMLPVHIASYRESGVLRRFDAAGFPRWAFPVSQFVIGAVFVAIGVVLLLATAALAYGLPGIEDPARTTIGILAGSLAFISIGVLLGTLLPNARAAQGVGLLLFLPMFLLAGGGPPPNAMSSVMNDIATALPLTHVVRAIQEPWLGLGTGTDHLVVVVAIFVVATLVTLARSGWFRRARSTSEERSDGTVTISSRGAVMDSVVLDLLDVGRAGDGDAFCVLVDPHRAELYAHCYRMLGSRHDADDAFQDTMLRAWRGLSGLEDEQKLRPWLYKIATNTCYDAIRRRSKRVVPIDCGPSTSRNREVGAPLNQPAWVERCPGAWLADSDRDASPDARYEQREAVELAYFAALQHLPGRQRAVLILREVLGYSGREVAELLETTVPSVNSALQRARKTVYERIPEQSQQATLRSLGDERVRDLVDRFIDALETGDVDRILTILAQDARFARGDAVAFGEAA